MRKKKIKAIARLGRAIAGVIFMANLNACSDGVNYTFYTSVDKELNISMDYVSGWSVQEHRGPGYASALFLEKKKSEGYKAGVSVTVKKKTSVKPEMATAVSMADAFVAQRLKLTEAKLLKRSRVALGYAEAEELLLSYEMLDKLYSLKAKSITVRERIIIFQRGEFFYILSYQNEERAFSAFLRSFDHSLRSLRFKDQE